MYREIADATYYGQMKDHRYEKLQFKEGLVWTNYEYHELLKYLLCWNNNEITIERRVKEEYRVV